MFLISPFNLHFLSLTLFYHLIVLNEEVIARIARAVSLAMITIPPTEIETENETPLEDQQHITSVPVVELTEWPIYTPKNKHLEKDYYFKKLFTEFERVNGRNRFQLIKSRDHILIKDGFKTIFRCLRNVESNPRNLYLELYSCQYNCEQWMETFLNNHNNLDYENTSSPPSYI